MSCYWFTQDYKIAFFFPSK
ncbi:tryptophanase leader peptide [Vibrio gelatinilyticus]